MKLWHIVLGNRILIGSLMFILLSQACLETFSEQVLTFGPTVENACNMPINFSKWSYLQQVISGMQTPFSIILILQESWFSTDYIETNVSKLLIMFISRIWEYLKTESLKIWLSSIMLFIHSALNFQMESLFAHLKMTKRIQNLSIWWTISLI